MPFGMDDLRRLSGMSPVKGPAPFGANYVNPNQPGPQNYAANAEAAVDKIMDYIEMLPAELGHHLANMNDEQKPDEIMAHIANSLREAAAKIESGNI